MLDRKSPPAFIQDTNFKLLKPENQNLNGDNKVLFINGGDQEVVKVELVFNAGRWFESKSGISHFTSILLPKGTPSLNSYQISNIFDFYGIHLEINPGLDFTSINLYGLSKNITSVLDLLIDMLTLSSFPETELHQAKEQYVQGLKINLEKTSYLAARHFRRILFGNTHPYGKDFELTDIQNLNQDELIGFRDNFFKNFSAFISGKIPDATKQQIADKLTQLIPIKIHRKQHLKSPAEERNQHIDKEGSIQTSLRMGKQVIGRTHSDYPGLLLLNHALGGFFGSRLMKNIREEKGLTYGIHSSIHPLKHESYFVISADVNRENRSLTINEIKKELEKICTHPLQQNEIDITRNHFIGSLQSDMSTPFAHADKIKAIELFNLDTEYYQRLINEIIKTNTKSLQGLAEKYFAESDFYTISVG